MPADQKNAVSKTTQNLSRNGVSVFLVVALIAPSFVSAATHFTLDGNVTYELGIDGGDDLTIKKNGGNGIAIADDTGNVTVDTSLLVGSILDISGATISVAGDANPTANLTGAAGDITYDTGDNELQYFNGSSWVSLVGADNLGDHTATQTLAMGAFNIDGTNFDVLGASGNTNIGGTLDVTGDFDVNSNFTVTAADGSLDMAGGTILSTNSTFQIDANNGTSGSLYLDGTYGRLQSPDENMQFNVRDTGLEFYAGSIVANINASGLQLGAGARVNDTETTLTDDDTHLPTSGAVVDYVAANGDDLGNHTATQELVMGAFNINGTNFDVLGASGNTTIGGTLDVTGALTAASIDLGSSTVVSSVLDDDAFTADSATALATQQSIKAYVDTEVAGAGDDLGNHTATTALLMGVQNIDGTNFDVLGASGNTDIGGTLDVAGDFDVNSNFTVTAASGNTTVGGTLAVDGASATISDGTLSVTEDSAATNSVVDVASITASSSGSVANNFGVGLTFEAEDSGGIEQQGSIDLVVTDIGDTTEDSEFIFSIQENGVITPEVTIAGGGLSLETGGAVNEIETTITDDDAHIPTSGAVVDYVAANGDNLGDHTATQDLDLATNDLIGTTAGINFDNFDVAATGNTTVGGTLESTGNLTVNTTQFTVDATNGNTAVAGTLGVTGATTLSSTLDVTGTLDVNSNFTVVAGNGNTTIGGTLTASSLTLTTGATVDDIETAITDDDTHIPTSGAIVDYVGTTVGDSTMFEASIVDFPGPVPQGSTSGIQSKFSSIALGDFSFAVGSGATANSNYSMAIGRDVTANNINSLALGGRDNQANANNAIAIGTGNIAESFGEIVIGLNADDSATPNSTSAFNTADLLFVIGNGASSGAKSNSLEMYKSGDTTINGDWSFNGWLDLGDGDPAANHTGMVEGSLAYDTNDDELQVYDGSTWQTIGTIGGGSDNLGNHIATQDLNMDGNWIGGDADGTEGIFVATDGDVGIGTATPGQRLDVAKETATTSAVEDIMAITSTTSGTAAAGFGAGLTFVVQDAGDTEEQASIDVSLDDATNDAEDASMIFNINQGGGIAEIMRIDGTDGFVGIGTSTPTSQLDATVDSALTSAVVDVAGINASSTGTPAAGFGSGLTFDVENGANELEERATIDVVMDDVTNGSEDTSVIFNTSQAGTVSELLRLDGTDGYIGFGAQTAPDVLMDIYQENSATNTIVDIFELELESSGTVADGLGMGLAFNIEDGGDTEEQARINIVLDESDNGSEEATMVFEVNVQGAMDEVMRIDGTDGRVGIGVTAPTEALDVTGNVKATGTFIPSDERLKENIATIPNALEKIGQLEGVTYHWIDKEKYSPEQQLGVIAQQVEVVFPQAVKTYEDDSKVVNYPALIAPVIQAINELKTENEALRTEIEALKSQEPVCLNPA